LLKEHIAVDKHMPSDIKIPSFKIATITFLQHRDPTQYSSSISPCFFQVLAVVSLIYARFIGLTETFSDSEEFGTTHQLYTSQLDALQECDVDL
jgi:hypothetical protein